MAKIKKNDMVKVIAGKDKGKTGKVLEVVVEGVNVYKKHQKQTATKEAGIVDKSMPIHVSNVVALDPKTGEPTSFRMKTLEDGKRVRVSKKTGETVE